jgi:hypothetical protein
MVTGLDLVEIMIRVAAGERYQHMHAHMNVCVVLCVHVHVCMHTYVCNWLDLGEIMIRSAAGERYLHELYECMVLYVFESLQENTQHIHTQITCT